MENIIKSQNITEDSIKYLVDTFYAKVRGDERLGIIFAAAIGHSDEEWAEHLQKMYDFWSSIMLTSGRYHGNPLKKHKDLPFFDEKLFNRWLELFAETANEIHPPEIAQNYISKSHRIAENLKFNLYYSKPNDFPFAPSSMNHENIT